MLRLRVGELLKERHMSISKLSRKADIAYKTAQAMVRYPDRGYNSKSLERVAQALEVGIGQLFENVEE